jgi:lysine 2,3-aminomutase
MKDLMGHTSGMAVPYYVIDAPGGGGKVRLLPNSVIEHTEEEVIITNYEGKVFHYSQRNWNNGSSNGSNKSTTQNQDMCQLPA